MKILILDENYPHLNNLMGDVFVHVRAKEYQKKHNVKIFSFFHPCGNLTYEGVDVHFYDQVSSLYQAIIEFNPDKILIHFYQSWMLEEIIKKIKKPIIIWVHGYEALGWYRRLFNYSWYSPVLLRYIKKNIYQQYCFRKLIQFANKDNQINFVFVSDWMRKITEVDSLMKIKNWSIIPNPIDDKLFKYDPKDQEKRKKILLLRSFSSRKYANDISIKAIKILSTKDFFKDLNFTIIGQGSLFPILTEDIKNLPNVILQERSVRQIQIPDIHKDYGIFLCPTRQDAQGVSMCEAMSSGLIPITCNNTAIPEFVSNNETGFFGETPEQVADIIEYLFYNSHVFETVSYQTAKSIRSICGIEKIVSKELQLIEK